MIYLIVFDRNKGKLEQFTAFENADRSKAEAIRLSLDLAQTQQDSEIEIVLLEAESEADVRLTHRRYFESLVELSRLRPEIKS